MIPALSFIPLSNVESAFILAIEKIYQSANQSDILIDILVKIDELASCFQKTYIKGKTIGRHQRDPLFPQLYGIITTTRRLVSFEQPRQLKAGITALRRFSRAATPQFTRF